MLNTINVSFVAYANINIIISINIVSREEETKRGAEVTW